MKSVQIQLTTKCNERCFMCRKYTWPVKELDFEILKEKLIKYKDCTITFSGGDPLAYSRLADLNNILKQYDIVYQVFTNMNYALDDEQEYFLSMASVIQVSFDGSSASTYQSVRRCKENGFDYVCRNIMRYSYKIKINCTVSNRNYFDVRNIFIRSKRLLGINEQDTPAIRFFPVHTDENALLQPWMYKHIQMQFEEMQERLPNSVRFLLNKKQEESFCGACYVKLEHRIVDEFGREFPCCRAINDNGEDWDGKYCVENLDGMDNPNVLYDFCKGCDRYVKFNKNWSEYASKERVFL